MCGFAGKINWKSNTYSSVIEKMCQKMINRGPDDYGLIHIDNITLGHRRLSIIDCSSRAKQPMKSTDGRFHIVYNGEIYNFKDLKLELEKNGIIFNTTSDTEVLLYSYIFWGNECLNRFNGMFSFAIWDKEKKELFLARDRFGKKPLYYYLSDKIFVFASDLTALMLDEEIPKKYSYTALNCYLALGYILSPYTYYKDVSKLEAATYLIYAESGKKITKKKYWDYDNFFRTKTKEDINSISMHLTDLLHSSVKKRMISDVPVGAFLSGGIDSSSVVAIMKKYHNEPLNTFSIGFSNINYNELPYAEHVSKQIGTIHHSAICEREEGIKLLNDAINIFDEPFADNSMIPMLKLSELASRHLKVVLSGDGADEIFAGYITYLADKYYDYVKIIPDFMKRIFIGTGNFFTRFESKKIGFFYKQKQFFYGTLYSKQKAHYLWRMFFTPEERINILGNQYRELVYDTDPYHIFNKYYQQVKDLDCLDQNLYVDAMTWLTDDILVKIDRASMQYGLEVRSPYLDVDLVEYAASIPSSLKLHGFTTKYILKKIIKNILPEKIIKRKKSGFNAPVNSWLKLNNMDEFKTLNKYVFDNKIKHNI
ncbi:MAG: hypothetical protein ACD_79C00431G0002 [uncultured bacterium]|nr:MAG: hypothetical protein ACD_79C00431G0002 [uncultured bacterium]